VKQEKLITRDLVNSYIIKLRDKKETSLLPDRVFRHLGLQYKCNPSGNRRFVLYNDKMYEVHMKKNFSSWTKNHLTRIIMQIMDVDMLVKIQKFMLEFI
jgi:hypothetical protein